MKLPKLSTGGSMRSHMLSVKTAPSIKLSDVKTTTGPKRPMTRSLEGHAINRGEMI
jgi:hypothetical protein